MEMCYNGALVMPSSFAVMDEEEMMYLEGGAKSKVSAVALLGSVFGIVGGVATVIAGFIGIATATTVVGLVGAALGIVGGYCGIMAGVLGIYAALGY